MVVGEPTELIGVVLNGPHPPSSRGNRYLITVIDYFSGWAEAYRVRNQEATTIARVLVNQ